MRLCVADIVLCLGTPGRSILSGWGGSGRSSELSTVTISLR